MESILLAIFFAYALILVEGFMPGGLFGLAGAACIVLATYFAYEEYSGILAPTLTFVLGAFGGLGGCRPWGRVPATRFSSRSRMSMKF